MDLGPDFLQCDSICLLVGISRRFTFTPIMAQLDSDRIYPLIFAVCSVFSLSYFFSSVFLELTDYLLWLHSISFLFSFFVVLGMELMPTRPSSPHLVFWLHLLLMSLQRLLQGIWCLPSLHQSLPHRMGAPPLVHKHHEQYASTGYLCSCYSAAMGTHLVPPANDPTGHPIVFI
jgi:hypothetical protein